MSRVVALVCIRSLYPNFLFKRGSIVHLVFIACLLMLIGSSLFGCIMLVRWPLEYFSVPFASALAYAGGIFWMWLLIKGIVYGVKYA